MASLTVGPEISVPPVEENVTTTEDLVLICSATGFPVPDITWRHNQTGLDVMNRDDINVTEVVSDRDLMSTLCVTNTSVNASGLYACDASSSNFAPAMSDAVLVLIQGKCYKPSGALYCLRPIIILFATLYRST